MISTHPSPKIQETIRMKIYSIYRVRNIITNESYIGFTSSTLSKRQINHRHKAFTQLTKNKFYSALRHYGWDNFEWSVIYQSKENCSQNDSHTLKVMEDYFINEYDSLNNGYNSIMGGGKHPVLVGKDNPMFGKKHKEESIALMKLNKSDSRGENNPMFGVKRTEEWINKHLKGENHPMFGVKRTEEWIDKHLKGENHPMYGKKHKKESLILIKGEDITCEHCGKTMNRGNYYRWHGSNCKHK